MYSIRIHHLITFAGRLEAYCMQIHLNSLKIFLLYPFCSFMTKKCVVVNSQQSDIPHTLHIWQCAFLTKYTMLNCMHFTKVPKSDEQFQETIHCSQKSSCVPLFISTDLRGRLQKLKSYLKPYLNPCTIKGWNPALHAYYFVDLNANLFWQKLLLPWIFVNSSNFRILVNLIAGKLLPVTTRLRFSFCSKTRYIFHYVSFQCAWRRSHNVTAA